MHWPPPEPLPPKSDAPPELEQAITGSRTESWPAGPPALCPPPLPGDAPPFLLPEPPPRLWTALVGTVLALLASVGSSAIVLVIALLPMGVFEAGRVLDMNGIIEALLNRPWGSTVLVLPGQLTLLGVAVAATLLARRRLAPRLGYTRSLLPWRALPLLIGGTFFCGWLGGSVAEWLFPEPSAGMQMILTMMQKPSGAGLAALAIMICVLPPLCEEALFRGYLQRRLLQRWPPAAAIAVSSVFFVAAHFDPEHVLAVIPLGVWLGVVAWRCDSLFPAMLCHCAQNSLALIGTRLGDPSAKGTSAPQLIVGAVAGVLFVGAVLVMRRHPVPGRLAVESAPAQLPAG